jgi:hypothetical protein
MPRAATTIKFTNADESVVVDFSGCRGYLDGCEQFSDDVIRETAVTGSDGTPRYQALVMNVGGANPHRGNNFGVTFDPAAGIPATKVNALYALNAAIKQAGSYMKAFLVDATTNLNGQHCKANPDVEFWLVRGRESEGMIESVRIFVRAI